MKAESFVQLWGTQSETAFTPAVLLLLPQITFSPHYHLHVCGHGCCLPDMSNHSVSLSCLHRQCSNHPYRYEISVTREKESSSDLLTLSRRTSGVQTGTRSTPRSRAAAAAAAGSSSRLPRRQPHQPPRLLCPAENSPAQMAATKALKETGTI